MISSMALQGSHVQELLYLDIMIMHFQMLSYRAVIVLQNTAHISSYYLGLDGSDVGEVHVTLMHSSVVSRWVAL